MKVSRREKVVIPLRKSETVAKKLSFRCEKVKLSQKVVILLRNRREKVVIPLRKSETVAKSENSDFYQI